MAELVGAGWRLDAMIDFPRLIAVATCGAGAATGDAGDWVPQPPTADEVIQ
jgi:hypothetical protein